MKCFNYDGICYVSEQDLRKALWFKARKVLPEIMGDKDWFLYGVTVFYEEAVSGYVEPRSPSLSELKEIKLGTLNEEFNRYRNSSKTFLLSSLGFKVNANVTAFNNVSGLIAELECKKQGGVEKATIDFMDFEDEVRQLTLLDLKTIQVEMSINNSNCYAQKWELRELIKSVENEEALSSIELIFKPFDFSESVEQ